MATAIPILRNGQITLPVKLRKMFGLDTGVYVEPVPTKKGILLKPKKMSDANIKEWLKNLPEVDAPWFWTKEWQKGEKEADADIKAGRVSKPYNNANDLIKALKTGKL